MHNCRHRPTHGLRPPPEDGGFALRWADAVEAGTEALESEARRRAMEGSDTLMIFPLKARRPEVYRERLSIDQRVQVQQLTSKDLERARRLGEDPEFAPMLERLAAAMADGIEDEERDGG